jgi:3-hydroxyacyl-CoA dehydrogenase
MGGGIAMAFANADIAVRLLDVDQTSLDRGLATIRKNYEVSVKRGKMTPAEVEQRMGLITATTKYEDFAAVDLAIEAVCEDMALKKKIFAELDRVMKPGAILATNTSTLDSTQIGAATKRPGDVVGLHFFSPANVMRLLEIVRTDRTTNDVLATAFALAKKLRKVGVLSKVSYGFIGNRMMDPYAREAERLALEGADPAEVDSALEEFGMAMGILAVFDMAGVDVGVKARRANPDQVPADDPTFYRASQVLFDQGWLGQKSGKGYYRYEAGSRERLRHDDALQLLGEEGRKLGVARGTPFSREEIVERCIYAMINEGAKLLQEGVALRPGDIDVVYTAGYGFPRRRGGPMFFADQIGLDTVLAGLKKYAASGNARDWQPAALLSQLAGSGSTFAAWAEAAGA